MSLLELFLLMLYFTLFVMWIWLLIAVYSDVFRSEDLGGFAKAAWVLILLLLPYLGVLVYLVARGGKMQERNVARAEAAQSAAQTYIREAAGVPSPAEELARFVALKEQGYMSEEEFAAQKAKLLA